MEEKPLSPPKASTGDYVHSLARAGIASLPVIGNAAVELFQSLVAPPLEKRRQEWMEAIGDGLQQLEQKQKCVLDDLRANDAFIDTVMQASQAAMRTSEIEKRDALRNAVLNSALPQPPDEARRQIYINLVETLTGWHLRMLRLFADPLGWYQANKRQPPQYAITSSLIGLLTNAYPELQNQREFCEKMANDLHNAGLLSSAKLFLNMSASGAFECHATELGKGFLRFVTAPNA
jgi:hypothetical protein